MNLGSIGEFSVWIVLVSSLLPGDLATVLGRPNPRASLQQDNTGHVTIAVDV